MAAPEASAARRATRERGALSAPPSVRRYAASYALFVALGLLAVFALTTFAGASSRALRIALLGFGLTALLDPLIFALLARAVRGSPASFMGRWATTLAIKFLSLATASILLIQLLKIEARPLLLGLSFGFILFQAHQARLLIRLVQPKRFRGETSALEMPS